MDTKVDKTPRQLAREYYNGLLAFAEYRELRRRVIEDITRVDTTRPLKSPADHDATTQEIPRKPRTEPPPAAGNKTGKWLLPAVAVVLVAVVAGWLLRSGDRGNRLLTDEPVMGHDAGINLPGEQVPAAPVLDEFLAADDWSYEALAGLTLAWSALQDQEQQAVGQTQAFRELSGRLRERVLEQRALLEIDSDAAEREAVLLSLAGHLGITGMEYAASPVAGSGVTGGQDLPAASVQAPEESVEAGEPAQQPVMVADEPVDDRVAATQPEPVPDIEPRADTRSRYASKQPPEQPIEAVTVTEGMTTETVAVAEQAEQAEPVEQVESAESAEQVEPAESAEPVEPAEQVAQVKEPAEQVAQVKEPATEMQSAATDACPASLARTRRPYCSDELADGSKGPVMVVLPAGSFRMGSDREASEQPVHKVTIARHFAMSAYEVSVADYRRFCKASGRYCEFPWTGDKDPVVNVSWKDVRSYTNWLSSMTGQTYRLPTEAEWEYAARARTTGDYPFGDGSKVLPSDARFNTSRPLPVDDRSVNANGFRLRHIIGNVSEWVEDAWFDNYQSVPGDGRARTSAAIKRHVVRGGSFADSANKLRSAARAGLPVDTRDNKTGFRLVREIVY